MEEEEEVGMELFVETGVDNSKNKHYHYIGSPYLQLIIQSNPQHPAQPKKTMQNQPSLTNLSTLLHLKLRSLLSNLNPKPSSSCSVTPLPPCTLTIRSLKPLQLADSCGFLIPCQTAAPRQLAIDETISFDEYQIDLEFTSDFKLKSAFLTVKSLLYGINQSRREKFFNGRFNLQAVITKPSKEILGCLNRLRKNGMVRDFGWRREDVLGLVEKVGSAEEERKSTEMEGELGQEHVEILRKLAKVMKRDELFKATIRHTLNDTTSKRILRQMVFPDSQSAHATLSPIPKKSFPRSIITTLLSQYTPQPTNPSQ